MKTNKSRPAKRPEKKQISQRRLRPSLASFRSAISNGSQLLPDIDGRSAWARRLRDLINDHVSDLGGRDMVSSSEMILIRRASMMCLQTELMEQHWADAGGEATPRQIDSYSRITSSLRRVLESLGLGRRARDVGPTLGSVLREAHRRDVEDAEMAP